MPAKSYDELKVNIRIKLAALWTALMFFYIYGDYFKLYIPDETGKLVSGDTLLDSPYKLFAASVMLALPPIAIILSVLAKASFARMVNIIFGLFFTAIMLLIAFTSIGEWWIAYTFYAIVESVITGYIVFIAWTWPSAGK